MNGLSVQLLTQDRLEETIDLGIRAFGNKSTTKAEAVADFPASLSPDFPRPYKTFIAIKDDKVVGATQCIHGYLSVDIYNIIWVCVDEDYRNQGVGRAVLEAACGHIENEFLKGKKGTIVLCSDINPEYYEQSGFSTNNKTHSGGVLMTKIVEGTTNRHE